METAKNITVIPARRRVGNTAKESEIPKLRVAAYCRVSTDSDEQATSYEAQVEHYTDYIRKNPEWEFAGIFADDGISGTNTKKREEFNRMIDEAMAGKIDMIVTKSISRFARNTLDCLKYIRQLKEKNIPVYFEKENINTMDAKGEVLLTIMASLAQQESQSLSQNVKLGFQYRYQQGQITVNHNRFLGYTKDEKGQLIIEPDEAEVVKRIFREYLEGASLQQIGRGLRKTDIKKNVIVIDVVDEYGAMVKACNMHSIFENPYYVPFGDITRMDYKPGEIVVIDGIQERLERISEVDIDSFENKYGDYLSQEQIAREFFVSTGTVTNWIKKKKIIPSAEYKFGSKSIYLFSPEDVEKYRKELNIKEHNDNTIKEDFFEFLEERDYSLSYKMPFMLSLMKVINTIGDANIEEILDGYIAFYQDRIDRGLQVDRATCPYNAETLKDRKAICRSMLTNPFEKFERKRFLYYSKDLSVISMNHALYSQMSEKDWERVRTQLSDDLKNYYSELGGL